MGTEPGTIYCSPQDRAIYTDPNQLGIDLEFILWQDQINLWQIFSGFYFFFIVSWVLTIIQIKNDDTNISLVTDSFQIFFYLKLIPCLAFIKYLPYSRYHVFTYIHNLIICQSYVMGLSILILQMNQLTLRHLNSFPKFLSLVNCGI